MSMKSVDDLTRYPKRTVKQVGNTKKPMFIRLNGCEADPITWNPHYLPTYLPPKGEW